MEILKKRLLLPLQFFAEGGEGGGAEGEGTAQEGTDPSIAIDDDDDLFLAEMEEKYGVANGVASAHAIESVRAKGTVPQSQEAKAEETKVATAEAEPTGSAIKTAEEEFDELIKGDKFKNIYGKKVRDAIFDRMKNQTDSSAEAERYKGTLLKFASKYGKDANDIEGIIAAVDADDSLLEDEAFKTGKTVSEIRTEKAAAENQKNTNQEIANLKNQLKDYQDREAARADAEKWASEAKETAKLYPSFDIRTELKNEKFMKYLREDGMSVTEAYEHAHLREIMASQLHAAEARADQNAAKIAAQNRSRVVENAAAFKSTNTAPRIDVRNMSESDFDKIEEMLNRGESVTLEHLM